MKSQLRDHQHEAMGLLHESLEAGHMRPMIQAPTGFGKTILAAQLVHDAVRDGHRVIFVVPAISLITQTAQRFWAEGIRDIGIIQADHPATNHKAAVQVASIQTVSRRGIKKLPHCDMVIIDEAHRWFKFYPKWMDSWNAIPFVGLSATPWTKGLGKYYDDLIIASTTSELIDAGYLSDFKVYAPSHPDLSKVRTLAGDYHEGDLSKVMMDQTLVSDIVTNWLGKGQNRPTLIFAVDRAHARKIQTDFLRQGVIAEYIDAYTTGEEREGIKKRFHNGRTQVVCNVGCLTTGVDWDVRCIILARPTKSEMLFVQMIGRGLRTADGKDHCLIFDHTDTHQRLGFVTDIHKTELDVGKKAQLSSSKEKAKEALPKDCKSCGFVKPPKVHKCPECGFAPQRQSDIEEVDGELTELKRVERRNKYTPPEDKEAFFGMLKTIAKRNQYKDGWAAYKYKERFGVWPNAYKDALMKEPTQDVLNWVKSRQIAWSRSQKRRAA